VLVTSVQGRPNGRIADMLIKFSGCLHAKTPYPEGQGDNSNIASTLVDFICEHRIMPHMQMPIEPPDDKKIVGDVS
jgi:hypothetical protein